MKKPKRPSRPVSPRPSASEESAAVRRAQDTSQKPGLMDEHNQAIQGFIDLLKQHNLAELEFEREGFRIRLKRESAAIPVLVAKSESVVGSASAQVEQPQSPSTPEQSAGMLTITSPIVGTFYRSPSPDADACVEEGDIVKKGQVLCIVEAMKLMNEIESEVNGRVMKILAESTKPVEYGQPLFLIDPSQTS